MKQRYNEFSHELAVRAAITLINSKSSRGEMLGFIEKYAGIPRSEMYASALRGDCGTKVEAAESVAFYLDEVVDGLMHGRAPEDMDPVITEQRKDGMTGKIRNISTLCILHQLLGHLVKLGLDPLLRARLLPQQHASIPRHGQTKVVSQTKHYLCKTSLDIKYARKTDVVHAYASIKYAAIIERLETEIPSATWILTVIRYLATLAPDGALIIGGYLDAWLFNLAMSYGIRYVLSLGRVRRGKFIPYVKRIEAQMDDFVLLGASKSGIDRAIKLLDTWMQETYGAHIRITTGTIRLLTVGEERTHKADDKPSKRGCPCVDVAGYRIYRSHITIRPRCLIRIRRRYMRAWREYTKTGTVQVQRARALIAYYGIINAAYSHRFEEKYHVLQLLTVAKRVSGFYSYRHGRQLNDRMARYCRMDDETRYYRWRST